MDHGHRKPWRNRLRSLIGPDVADQASPIGSTTDRMRAVRNWLCDEAPEPFRNLNLKDGLARYGYEVNHCQIGTILTRLIQRGEIAKVGHSTYRVNREQPALEEITHR